MNKRYLKNPRWKKKLEKGWLKTPVIRMYADDGKSMLVEEGDVRKYEVAGWYNGEPIVLYDEYGNEKTVGENDAELFIKNGWSKIKPQIEESAPVYEPVVPEMSSSKRGFVERFDELSGRVYSAEYSYDIYMDWDQLLNEVYHYLEATMSDGEFSALEQDEFSWIYEKEAASAQQSDAYKDSTAISFTRGRCEYLILLMQ